MGFLYRFNEGMWMRLQSKVTICPALIMLLLIAGCKQKQSVKSAQNEPSAANRPAESAQVSKNVESIL